jgi:hypothetical protein
MKDACFLRRALPASLLSLGLLLGACAEDSGPATLRITAYGEEFIEDRIPADVFVDGWDVEFSRFLVAISEVEADGVRADETFIVDLAVPSGGEGHELTTLELPAGGRPRLGFRVGPVADDAVLSAPPDLDLAPLTGTGASLWVVGQATKGDQAIEFAWAFATDTRYVECQSTAELVEGGAATSQLTIHADHFFYDDLDSEEPNVAFELVASADADADGEVTAEELRALDITSQARYQVGSRDITDLWSFIEAQTGTLGHIDGEGHCELGP